MRLILPNFSSRYAAVIAVKVLPAPVAICTSALGRFSAKEVSRFWIAVIWHLRNPVVSKGGKCFMLLRMVSGFDKKACSVSGR